MNKTEFDVDFDNMLITELPSTYDLLVRNNAIDNVKKNKIMDLIKQTMFEEVTFVLSSIWKKDSDLPVVILQIGFNDFYPRLNMKGTIDNERDPKLSSINLTRNSFSANLQKSIISMFLSKNLKAIISKQSDKHIIIGLKSDDHKLFFVNATLTTSPTTELIVKLIQDSEFQKLRDLYLKLNTNKTIFKEESKITGDCGCHLNHTSKDAKKIV